jgi:phosphoribosylaminoimidazole carboxylase
VEIEHVDANVLEQVEKEGTCQVQPSPATIRLIQDKYLQKRHLTERGLAVAPFEAVPSNPTADDFVQLGRKLGLPMMLKSRTLAYDGKGNAPLNSIDDSAVSTALKHLSAGGPKELYAEAWAPFQKEVAVMVVRNVAGEVRSYDAVETVHKDSILRVCLAPLRVRGKAMMDVNRRAKELAEKAVATLEGAGIFGVEMFLMEDGEF